jgi:hypothetical protein
MRGKELLRIPCRGKDPIVVTRWSDGMIEINDGDLDSIRLTRAQVRKLIEGISDAIPVSPGRDAMSETKGERR